MTTSPVFDITPFHLAGDALELARTDTRTHAVHLTECPHLVGRDWHLADEDERTSYPLCSWSRDQLEGHGRSHPDTLEDAMREQGTPAEAVALIKEHLKFVTYDGIWLPYSKSYVAAGSRVAPSRPSERPTSGSEEGASSCPTTSGIATRATGRSRRTASPALGASLRCR